MNKILSKYRAILVPLSLVVLLDTSLLIANFIITNQLEVLANNINISGRQRMLSQKITKSLSLIAFHQHNNNDTAIKAEKNDLKQAVSLFDETLMTFLKGGKATSSAGAQLELKNLSGGHKLAVLSEANALWKPRYHHLNDYLSLTVITKQDTYLLLNDLARVNITLLDLMNQLTTLLEQDADRKTALLRAIQTTGLILIIMSFMGASYRLYRRERYYNALMKKSKGIVISINTKTAFITFVSSSASEILGYDDKQFVKKPATLFFADESKADIINLLEHVNQTNELKTDRLEVTLLTSNGKTIIADMIMQLTMSESGRQQELTADIRDISALKALEQALLEQAHKDALTGLPNRTLFYEFAGHAITLAKRQHTELALMFIDLDGFKFINDHYGHAVGDGVLIETANRIAGCLRESDSVARMGGDEFIVLLEHASKQETISTIGHKITNAISEPYNIHNYECNISASIGIATYPNDARDIETLIKKADDAMYAVKAAGKNDVGFSTPS
jgi:diguanylate cyclase (GGDEF)-like protein/PAS domain S-box-containing protein